MESWESFNYYTTNQTQWVKLMNLSTTEWGLGNLPSNLFAIPATINDTYHFPDDSLVIENACKGYFGIWGIESVIFGTTSGIALLWAIVWLIHRYKQKTFFIPRTKATTARPREEYEVVIGRSADIHLFNRDDNTPGDLETGDTGLLSDERFRKELLTKYYENVLTELEINEKDIFRDGEVTSEDVEAVTDLVRKMYRYKLSVIAERDALDTEGIEEMERKGQATLNDIRRIMSGWAQFRGWEVLERNELQSIFRVLGLYP
ncbi:hypothetical protein BJ170DRAFT_501357 [Xylariales sp. AK1849]|nr:hypothetical protein BJ170DRAFT_501357 [Xylariales sp. AK1849]